MLRKLSACFVLILTAAAPVWAQASGRITGSVIDPAGRSIGKARIRVYLAGGAQPLAETESSAEGLFSVETIRPELYDLGIEALGFQPAKIRNVKVDPARATDLPPVKLEIFIPSTTVEVTAGAETVQATLTDLSTTVTTEQILRLPVADRNPLDFVATQAGVASGANGTAINGQRTSASNMMVDGVNIQDPWIKDNALSFTPNKLELDSVREFTVTTSNSSAANSGGSGVSFSTPSGTNTIHGALYWQNRNNKFAANDWFNNTDGIELPRLNLNSVGGKVGGPIQRDKLFYFVNYEATRSRSQLRTNQPILSTDARQGIFTYRANTGQITKVNVLNFVGLKIDPVMAANLAQTPGPDKINNFRVGDSQTGQLLNTAGYSFLVRDNEDRNSVTSRLDYTLSTKNSIAASFRWNSDVVDRPDLGIGYSTTPVFSNDNSSKLYAMFWRFTPNATLTNELRGGFNFAPGYFIRSGGLPDFFVGGTIWGNPQVGGLEQGRLTRTYNLQDKATWVHGRHTVGFGYFLQSSRTGLYDYAGTVPSYGVGTGSLEQQDYFLFPGELRGASAADTNIANALIASLGGVLDTASAQFNVTSRSSGFVQGAPLRRNWQYDNHAVFVEDTWKAHKRVTLTLGVRWDYFTPVNERDSLALQPILRGDPKATLLSNATLYFAGNDVQRPLYRKDGNNFGPNVGVAWDVFGNGRTSFRAGYSAKFINDQQTTVADAYSGTNAGLTAGLTESNLTGFIGNAATRPKLVAPPYFIPRRFSDNYNLDPGVFHALVDPGLSTPYVQEFTASIQHEFKGTIFEARYVGNHAVKMLRGFDYNQIDIKTNGFLADFLKAQSNGNLARTATGVFNPAYDARIPGSQVLSVFPRLPGTGFLTAGVVRSLIDRGEPAELGLLYQFNGLNGPVSFYPNANTLVSILGTNFASSRYDSLQLEARRRFQKGLEFQGNYVFSKWLSNTAGTDQLRFEPFLDINNAALERSRNPFDITHQLKGNYSYDLPLVSALKVRRRWLRQVVDGWSTSGNLVWQSGNPYSIASQRGTFLPAFFSGTNEANTLFEKGVLNELLTLRKTGDGIFMVPASVRGTDGRAVAADGSRPFTGQIFFNPGAGQVGALQRRMFTGPKAFSMDAGLRKEVTVTERIKGELKLEALNVFNHATFATFTQNINSTQFGRVQSMLFTPRRLQMSLRVSF